MLYTRLWHSLCDLKDAADVLWERAIDDNLQRFSEQLEKTSKEIEKSFLFIEDAHYRELSRLMEEFNDYEFGKDSLIRLYEMRQSSRRQVQQFEIENLIDDNRERKKRFENLIRVVGVNLRSQLRNP